MTGYAELLYSITDNDQLFRDGSLESTESFISSMTQVRGPANGRHHDHWQWGEV
jgi:hypothetical protein